MERTILKREIRKKETPFGTVIAKMCTLPDGQMKYYPEYDNAVELAKKNQISLQEAYDEIRRFWTTER